jgi:hypothetical protein
MLDLAASHLADTVPAITNMRLETRLFGFWWRSFCQHRRRKSSLQREALATYEPSKRGGVF